LPLLPLPSEAKRITAADRKAGYWPQYEIDLIENFQTRDSQQSFLPPRTSQPADLFYRRESERPPEGKKQSPENPGFGSIGRTMPDRTIVI
jgi:hypothetical protein